MGAFLGRKLGRGFGFRVQGAGFRVQEFRISGVGFISAPLLRVEALGVLVDVGVSEILGYLTLGTK